MFGLLALGLPRLIFSYLLVSDKKQGFYSIYVGKQNACLGQCQARYVCNYETNRKPFICYLVRNYKIRTYMYAQYIINNANKHNSQLTHQVSNGNKVTKPISKRAKINRNKLVANVIPQLLSSYSATVTYILAKRPQDNKP